MPKVISRGTTVSSGNETQFTDEKIFVYYCVCGTLCLTLDAPLEKLPRRKTDNAYIIQASKREFRFKTQPLEPVTFKRDKGFEKQYRAGCIECGLPVSYTPKEKDSPLTYVLPGALRLQQYGMTTDPLPLEEIKELPGVEYEEFVAEQRKEKLREEEEGDESAARGPLRLSDLPRHEQERQIREKLKSLERGEETPIHTSSAPSTTSSSSSSSSLASVPTTAAAAAASSTSSSSSSTAAMKRDESREKEPRKREREDERDQPRRSRSPEEKRRRRSRSPQRSRSPRSRSRERDRRDKH